MAELFQSLGHFLKRREVSHQWQLSVEDSEEAPGVAAGFPSQTNAGGRAMPGNQTTPGKARFSRRILHPVCRAGLQTQQSAKQSLTEALGGAVQAIIESRIIECQLFGVLCVLKNEKHGTPQRPETGLRRPGAPPHGSPAAFPQGHSSGSDRPPTEGRPPDAEPLGAAIPGRRQGCPSQGRPRRPPAQAGCRPAQTAEGHAGSRSGVFWLPDTAVDLPPRGRGDRGRVRHPLSSGPCLEAAPRARFPLPAARGPCHRTGRESHRRVEAEALAGHEKNPPAARFRWTLSGAPGANHARHESFDCRALTRGPDVPSAKPIPFGLAATWV